MIHYIRPRRSHLHKASTVVYMDPYVPSFKFPPGADMNSDCVAWYQGMGYIPPTDDAGLASGLVLREVHSALLRGADGKGLSSDGSDAPRTAKLAVADPAAGAWTGRVSKAILDAPPFAVDDDARVCRRHCARVCAASAVSTSCR